MIDKGINIKKIDLSGVSFPTNDASTCALIYTAVRNTYGFPLYLTNFKINDEKRNAILVNPIILENQTIINLNDCHLVVTPTEISVGKGMYETSLESIVDSDRHNRFFVGTPFIVEHEGVEHLYLKYVMNGRSLRIVDLIKLSPGANVNPEPLCAMDFSDTSNRWLMDKIVAVTGQMITRGAFTDLTSSEERTFSLVKNQNYNIWVFSPNQLTNTTENDMYFRIEFNLIIE